MNYGRYTLRRLKYAFGGYKKKRCRRYSFSIFYIYVLLFIALISFSVFYGGQRIGEISTALAYDQINNNMRNICNNIAEELIKKHSLTHSSIFTTHTDETGGVQSLNTNFDKINGFKQDFEQDITQYLNENNYIKCYVPLGAVFCKDLFSSAGLKIPIGILVSSHTELEFCDTFSSAGVNQTKHTVLLKVKILSKLHNSLTSSQVETNVDIPIAESIIVGDVPSVMLKEMQ